MCFKKIWNVLWEPEDSHGFGQLFLIVSAVLVTKSLDNCLNLMSIEYKNWIYLGIGILLALYGARLIWVSDKKREKRSDIVQTKNISKKESELSLPDEKSLKLWQEVAKDEYLTRRAEWAQADSKISSLLIIVLAIIGITIEYMDISNLLDLQKGVYIFSLIFLGISFLCCLIGMWPKRLDVINFEHNKNNSYRKELLVLKSQYALAIKNQNSQLDSKLCFFKISSISFFIGLLILILIKLGVTF